MSDGPMDPVELEINWSRLVSLMDEADAAFRRTSFSTLVRDANDYAIVLTDTEGNAIAQPTITTPSFIGTLPMTVRHILRRHPIGTLAPDDVLITNELEIGTGQIHDFNVLAPIHHRGRPVAVVAVTSHMPDIGGRLRGVGAREVYEEGIQIPLMKLVSRGEVNETLVAMIRQNVRTPDLTLGDLWGEVAACHRLAEGLSAFLDETGIDLARLGAEIRRRTQAAMEAAIRALPGGTWHARVENDSLSDPIVVQAAVTLRDGRCAVDCEGSSRQVDRAINVMPAYTYAYTCYVLKCLLLPSLPNNAGAYAPMTVTAPLGSILNPIPPIASGSRHLVGQLLPYAVMEALAPVLPDRVWAHGSPSCSFTVTGRHRGRAFTATSFMNGGQGATRGRDGLSALCFPSVVGNTATETLETLAPIVIRDRAIARGTGGAGRHRGGDGSVAEVEYRGDEPGIMSFILARTRVAARGLEGGEDGALSRLTRNGEPIGHTEPIVLQPGDVIRIALSGGGGFGRPGAPA